MQQLLGSLMDTTESQLAVTKERVRLLEKWQDSCHWMEQAIHELVQWKRDQNGDIKDIKEDLRDVKNDIQSLNISQGRMRHRSDRKDRMLKWVLGGVSLGSFVAMILSVTGII